MKTAIERITKQRAQLILSQPFFGTLALRLRPVERHDIQTMAVDGKHLFYNPAFVDSFTDEELRGVIAHEVMHCVHHHMTRRGSRDPCDGISPPTTSLTPKSKPPTSRFPPTT
jgi:predicted metal-dependent peptidase